MSFHARSTAATLLALVVATAAFGALTLSRADATSGGSAIGPIVVWIIAFVVVVAVLHIGLAIGSPREAGEEDERDRLIEMRGERTGGLVLGLGSFVALVLAIGEADHFWIAVAIFVALVASEVASSVAKLIDYRRGV